MAAPILNEELRKTVNNCKTLVVGAGGIGCELIKNLVLTGFEDLVIVDLDTIDVSNLNRQFLFQKQHVGRSKVEVARESALLFNPNATIRAIHDSILSEEYNVSFYKQFSIVLNALDNKKARNHVNRMCLAAGVTLVESGSAGYLGQVTVIKKGESECYECQPKPAAKTFPGCTIRNTPSEPIHCIVWAKHLFNQLFGEADADNDVAPDSTLAPGDDMVVDDNEEQTTGESKEAEMVSGVLLSTRGWAEMNQYDPKLLLNKLFVADINYLLTMDKLWKTRTPPVPMTINEHCLHQSSNESNSTTDTNGGDGLLPDQRVWSVNECVERFMQCVSSLHQRQCEVSDNTLTWDKDCTEDLEFVVSASNLRARVFGISMSSKFTVKSMAGNIIPAIATTNAVISGLIVMEALKILGNEFHKCKTTYLPKYPNSYKRLLVPCSLIKPNPKCYVCSPRPEATIQLNTKTVTMATLRDGILKECFGMIAPDVELEDGKGTILISSEEGETDDNLPRVLHEFGIGDSSRLKADDFLQNYQLIINIVHSEHALEEEKEFVVVLNQNQSDDGSNGGNSTLTNEKKRKLSTTSDDEESSRKKRTRITEDENNTSTEPQQAVEV